MSTRRNTATNNLVPQTDPEAIIRQANTEKRRIKANVEQHLLGLATGTIKPTSDPVDPDFLTSKCLLTTTPDPSANHLDTTQTSTSSSSQIDTNPPTNTSRPPTDQSTALQISMSLSSPIDSGCQRTPPPPTVDPLNPPSTFLRPNTMLMQDYLKVVMATQQATMAQAQADRKGYACRLARQDADATVCQQESASWIARLEEAVIGMTTKLQTPEHHSHSSLDDVNLRTFRTSDGPTYTGPYQDCQPPGTCHST
ncbi:hypothetical protein PSTG_04381 [Puccinia striiformis f. sp. tritici PST-78]|uniref:Uncharacterized protein n=1 Tax=Puccinia striiformis f. sp. tritici PST-78 TaxID=1165861 RepID=A0A0L0VU21_9BASI|nr:hypothetical protein PSTG_04381 [Puccinia striiformis f. sp. tritici PST-78]